MVPNAKTERMEAAPQVRDTPDRERASSFRADQRDLAAFESPARRLQLELERSWASAESSKRWSARRSLAFILLSNGLLWAALIWGVTKVA